MWRIAGGRDLPTEQCFERFRLQLSKRAHSVVGVEPRQLVAGIRAAYDVRSLPGQQVVVVANLKPAMLRGVESRGMLLAASDDDGLAVVAPGRRFKPGTRVK